MESDCHSTLRVLATLAVFAGAHLLYLREGNAWRGVRVRLLGGDAHTAVVQGEGVAAGAQVAISGGNLLKTLAPVN